MLKQFSVSILDAISDRVSNRALDFRSVGPSLLNQSRWPDLEGRAAVVKWLNCSSPAKVNRVRFPPGSIPDSRYVGIVPDDTARRRVFSGVSPLPPRLHSGAAPFSPRFALIGSLDPDVRSRPNLFNYRGCLVLSLAHSGDGRLDVRVSVALIAPAPVCIQRGTQLQAPRESKGRDQLTWETALYTTYPSCDVSGSNGELFARTTGWGHMIGSFRSRRVRIALSPSHQPFRRRVPSWASARTVRIPVRFEKCEGPADRLRRGIEVREDKPVKAVRLESWGRRRGPVVHSSSIWERVRPAILISAQDPPPPSFLALLRQAKWPVVGEDGKERKGEEKESHRLPPAINFTLLASRRREDFQHCTPFLRSRLEAVFCRSFQVQSTLRRSYFPSVAANLTGRIPVEVPPVSLLTSHRGDPGSIPGRATPDFRKWESCRTMPLVDGFPRGSPIFPAPPPLIPAPLHIHFNHPRRLSRPRCQEPPKSLHSSRVSPEIQDDYGNTARLARRSDEALGMRVSVARIATSLLDLERDLQMCNLPSCRTGRKGHRPKPAYILADPLSDMRPVKLVPMEETGGKTPANFVPDKKRISARLLFIVPSRGGEESGLFHFQLLEG
ncbi:hypothetical protein PR048_010587 [Dryococelus australis]|uniref:Uncharacterized protein n=1 Tax=Dryococelus australis TaxID=614101 RepID=A0ABQ9I355_9NEOP|nr:hypothetical protein PR048_010587 [Dryococelus australis]